MSHGAGPAEKMANQQSAETEANRNRELSANDASMAPLEGPAEGTGLYKTLVQTGRDSVSRGYQGAADATRANAHSAGFGYEQPITQAADEGLQVKEGQDLSQVPRDALSTVTNAQLQADGIRAGEVSSMNPSSLTGTAVNAETQRQGQMMGLIGNLAKLGTSFIPVPKLGGVGGGGSDGV